MSSAIRTIAPLIDPPMMAPLLVVPLPDTGAGVLESVADSDGVPSGVDESVGVPGDLVVDGNIIADVDEEDSDDEESKDEDGFGDICEDVSVGGRDVSDGDADDVNNADDADDAAFDSVLDAVEGEASPGSFDSLEGRDPIDVGSVRGFGDAVNGIDVSSNTKLVMPSTEVSTVVPRFDAVPQPNWKYPPAN
ncbi:hypothetical protein AAE478_000498 [Parahypoxylon ruwenzoriense]